MKKKSSLITLIFAVIIIVAGYFVYQKYLAPLYANNLGQHAQIDLKKNKTTAFGIIPGRENIFGIEIEITGKTSSIFGINIRNQDQIIHNARVKGGDDVEFIYKADWYSDSLYLDFEVEDLETGVLEIECRFLGMN